MKTIFYPEQERGYANHGWLIAQHSFSFANWYHPDKMNFGALRVLNDDIVAPKMGFGMHPHDNMEIITIPLEGQLKHQDSMGHTAVIKAGEIQVMSAGTGIYHSEVNPSLDEKINLFQIWIIPNKRQVEPRYDQRSIDWNHAKKDYLQLISPHPEDEGSWIHQDAWIFLRSANKGDQLNYSLQKEGNGVYIMVINGAISINDQLLNTRDAIGVWETSKVAITLLEDSQLLFIDVPMNF